MIFFKTLNMAYTHILYRDYYVQVLVMNSLELLIISSILIWILGKLQQITQHKDKHIINTMNQLLMLIRQTKLAILLHIFNMVLINIIISTLSVFYYVPLSLVLLFEWVCILMYAKLIVIYRYHVPITFKLQLKIGIILILLASIIPIVFHRTCICHQQDNTESIQVSIGHSVFFNTYISRYLTLPKQCDQLYQVCQIYPTHPEDIMEAVFINVHTHEDVKSTQLIINQISIHPIEVQYLHDNIEWQMRRNIYTFRVNLSETNNTISFHILIDNVLSIKYHYKSPPKVDIVMAMGGDVGSAQLARDMWLSIAKYKPDLIAIGGDIAYDNGMIECAYTWDRLLEQYTHMTNQLGYLIPLILTIGNHDVGTNAGGAIPYVDYPSPLYYTYFPQTNNLSRLSYFYHKFNDVILFSLDSEFVTAMEDQTQFIIDTINNEKPQLLFAQYHDPIYWGCSDNRADQIVNTKGVKYWVPLFDKYHFKAAFENHAHSQKRSKPLINSTYNPDGTIYLGDGSWGTLITKCKMPGDPNLIDNWQGKNNVWITQIGNDQIHYFSIDTDGMITDSTVQSRSVQKQQI